MGLAHRAEPEQPAPAALAGGSDAFSESTRRAALRVREIVRSNGDATAFAFEKGVLVRGAGTIPAVLVGSELAVHIIEYHSRNSAVCSYNRVLKFDEVDDGADSLLTFSFYMGETPVAQRLALGTPFGTHELATYRMRVPRTADLRQVLRAIGIGVAAAGRATARHATHW